MTVSENKNLPYEEEEHLMFMNWARFNPICRDYLIHIPNEGKRTLWSGRKLKNMGMRKGVSDFFLAYPTTSCNGLWIELKRMKVFKISDEQKLWINRMILCGFAAEFAFGWLDAKRIVENYLSDEVI